MSNTTERAERAQRLVEDWHEGVPAEELQKWCRAAAGALAGFAQDAATPPEAEGAVLTDAQEPPLLGRWHHGEGHLCSGTLRIARADFDTNPSREFQAEVFQWITDTLNAELARYRAAIDASRRRGES